MQVNDPASASFFGTGGLTSGIEIPVKGVDFYHAKDVPHGEVRSRWYKSSVTGQTRHIMVYTPGRGMTATARAATRSFICNTGAARMKTGWARQGHMNFILDN